MTHALESLIAQLTGGGFRELLRRRELRHLPPLDAAGLESLAGWARLEQLALAQPRPANSIQVTRNAVAVPRAFYCNGPVVDVVRLSALFRDGHSLIVKQLPAWCDHMAHLQRRLREVFNERVSVAAVVTWGDGAAMPLHFDPYDVLALQIEGAKRWRVFDRPIPNATGAMRSNPRGPEGDTLIDVRLAAGDRLFVPAGYSHRCANEHGRSVHLAVLFDPPCVQNVLEHVAKRLAADPTSRLPLGRDAAVDANDAIKAAILEKVSALSADEMVAGFVDSDISY